MRWLFRILILQSIVSSLWMAVKYHTTFWGDLVLLGSYRIPGEIVPTVTFDQGIWIGVIGAWYLVSQLLPLVARPSRSPWFVGIDMFTSIPPIAEMGAVLMKYFVLDGFRATPYQIGAMRVWSVIEVSDLLLFIVSMYLLLRAIGVVQTVSGGDDR